MYKNIVCLSGHRPKSLPWGYNENMYCCKVFKEDLEKIFINAIEYGIHTFLTGMAEGFDMIATEILIKLKEKYKHIRIIAVIPCKNQEAKWRFSQQIRYRRILRKCDNKIVLLNQYEKDCMIEGNKYMILRSEFCIACWNGNPSGTGKAVQFAMENKKRVRIIDIKKYYNLNPNNSL